MDSKENNNTSEEIEMVNQEEEAAAAANDGEPQNINNNNNQEESNKEEEPEPESDPEPDNNPKPSIEGASPGKIFVGGLPKETTAETFTGHFGKYGEITDSVIMNHRGTGHPRGFGFITYKDPAVVDVVILDTHIIDGKQVEIKRTIPKGAISGKDFKTKKIFVGGIPTSVNDDDEFKNFFSKFGEVEECQIMWDRTSGRSRGFGFISFSTEKAVDDLLTKGNRIDFAGAQVEIKKAEPKKSGNAPPPPPAKHFSNPMPAFGRGFKGPYGAVAGGGIESGAYRYGAAFGGRSRGYGGYGGNEFDGGYGGYGGTGIWSYGGEFSLGFSAPYGGGLGRGYDLGGYDGQNESYGRYGGAAGYGSGHDSGPGVGYGGVGGNGGSGAGLYGTRRDYGGGPDGRYHPYGR